MCTFCLKISNFSLIYESQFCNVVWCFVKVTFHFSLANCTLLCTFCFKISNFSLIYESRFSTIVWCFSFESCTLLCTFCSKISNFSLIYESRFSTLVWCFVKVTFHFSFANCTLLCDFCLNISNFSLTFTFFFVLSKTYFFEKCFQKKSLLLTALILFFHPKSLVSINCAIRMAHTKSSLKQRSLFWINNKAWKFTKNSVIIMSYSMRRKCNFTNITELCYPAQLCSLQNVL